METEIQALTDRLGPLMAEFEARLQAILLVRGQIQIGIIIGCFVLAFLLRRWIAPRVLEWMRTLEGWPKWRLRTLLVIQKRLQLIFFVILSWMSVGIMAQVRTFPSWRNLLVLAATIATAVLLVSVATRLVRNRFLRRIVTWGLWIYVTLYYLGMVEAFSDFLDGMAVEFGDFRLSALAIVKALVVTGILFTVARLISTTTSSRIRENEDISPSMRVLAVKMLQIVLYGSAFFIGLKAVGFDLTGLAVLSGAIGVGLGFGLQKVVSNLVSGVIIL